MCVIIAKKKKGKSPDIETFERAMDANPHGFSIALKTPNEPWRVFKTMEQDEMIEFIKSEGVLRKNSQWVFHARIKTHGEASLRNCHCWRDKKTDTIFAHNGTLGVTADDGKTDSETFYRHMLVPIYHHQGLKSATKACKIIANGHNKIALICEKEKKPINLIGNWIKSQGIYYSNSSAFEPKPVKTAGYGMFPNGFNDFEDNFGCYWNNKAKSYGRKLCTPTTQPSTHSTIPSHSQVTLSSTENKKPAGAVSPVSNTMGAALA